MKRILPLALALLASSAPAFSQDNAPEGREAVTTFDKTIFYDGYKTDEVVDKAADDGIFRFRNHTYYYPLTEEFCKSVSDDVTLDVVLGALCDNYDRFGNFSLMFVPKGEPIDTPDTPDRYEKIEIARYITPFMNMRKKPNEVPYTYFLPDLGIILRDPRIHEKYDLWLEAYLFGVPYAANEQILGCKGRNDVFTLTATFTYDPQTTVSTGQRQHIVPIATVRSEEHGEINFNNYRETATDTIGVTTKTWKFNVPADMTDSKIVLINTNHGSAAGGEEYIRRQHLVYVDGEIAMVFTPGGVSCEPYRRYNTQANGIYGVMPSPASGWAWNNWCPGQAVPIREIRLGALPAGEHSVMIRVPDAEFVNNTGDFRPGLYFQGVEEGKLPSTELKESSVAVPEAEVEWRNEGNVWHYASQIPVSEARVYTYDGRLVLGEYNPGSIDLRGCAPGVYIITLRSADGASAFRKVTVR